MTQAQRILADIARHADHGVGVREAIQRNVDTAPRGAEKGKTMQGKRQHKAIDERAAERAAERREARLAARAARAARRTKRWERGVA